MKKKVINNDEIDLINLLVNIWNKKNTIILISLIFVSLSYISYQIIKPAYLINTKIEQIDFFDESKFNAYNSIVKQYFETQTLPGNNNLNIINLNNNDSLDDEENDIFKKFKINLISREFLLTLFIEKFEQREILAEAIKKYELLDRSKYENDLSYLKAIKNKAYSVKLIPPTNIEGKKKGPTRLNWEIHVKVDDKNKWEKILKYTNDQINENIRLFFINNIKNLIDDINLSKEFKINELNNKIQNLRIENKDAFNNRISFLEEQSLLAKNIGLENNILTSQNYNTSSLKNSIYESSAYYMRGYKVIDKEIEILKNRAEKKSDYFIEDISKLKNQILSIKTDNRLKNFELIFNKTPIIKSNNFNFANILISSSQIKNTINLIFLLIISFVVGLIFAIIYTQTSTKK